MAGRPDNLRRTIATTVSTIGTPRIITGDKIATAVAFFNPCNDKTLKQAEQGKVKSYVQDIALAVLDCKETATSRRNAYYTEFLPIDPDKADQDLRDVLSHGLMDEADKQQLSTLYL